MTHSNHSDTPTESDLVERLRAGDREAFHQLVSSHHGKLLTVARAIVGDAFAEEVVQDAWEAVIKAIHTFQGRSSLSTWLTQIVGNRAKTRLKREKKHVSLDEGWQDPDQDAFHNNGTWSRPPQPWHQDSPEALLSSSELQQLLINTVDKLPPKQRAVLTLHDIEGMGFEEICNILDVSQSNVRVLLHRARLVVRTVIDEYQKK